MLLNSLPKITLITPSYNQGIYIEQTIRSVIDQGYPNLEYIVIDGGSSDNTIDILKKYHDNITYWVSEPDKGQTDAINKGFQLATGDIINWLNSDDYLAPGVLFEIAYIFQSDPKLNAVSSVVKSFTEEGLIWDEKMPTLASPEEYITKSLLLQPGTFFLRKTWIQYFPLPTILRYAMDQYLWFCFWLQHQPQEFVVKDFTTTFFRRHASSKTVSSADDFLYYYLSKDFFNEYNLLFWSFYSAVDPEKANVISRYFFNDYDYESRRILFPGHLYTSSILLTQLYEQYLFILVQEDFNHGYFKRMNDGLKILSKSPLLKRNPRMISKLRIAGVAGGVVRQYRKIYWRSKEFGNR